MRTVGVMRAKVFSPGSVEKDRAILEAVVGTAGGILVSEDELDGRLPEADIYLSMARKQSTLRLLNDMERKGRRVVNTTVGVARCRRDTSTMIMRQGRLPLPDGDGSNGWWIKRCDGAACEVHDVQYCHDTERLRLAIQRFEKRNIPYIIEPHVEGDLLKFYGVADSFFHVVRPQELASTDKFGNPFTNSVPLHHAFDHGKLASDMARAAALIGVEIYGGDAIVRADGSYAIIDFNDWPSFSPCRETAAKAIYNYVF